MARLDEIEGVSASRVDWTGRYFLLTIDPSARRESVVKSASDVLGSGTRELDPRLEADQVAALQAGEPWLRAGETAHLSQEEARVVAKRHVASAAADLDLDTDRTNRVTVLMQDELERLFHKFESAGLPARAEMMSEWNAMVDRIGERSREFLIDSERANLAAKLKDCWSR
jgi:hypothetical protein